MVSRREELDAKRRDLNECIRAWEIIRLYSCAVLVTFVVYACTFVACKMCGM